MFSALGISVTAIWGLVSGILTGIVPDLLEEFKKSRDDKRKESEHSRSRDLQTASASVETEKARLDHVSREAAARYAALETEIKAVHATVEKAMDLAARPTGFPWIDGFNACLRPALGSTIMLLFAIIVLYSVFTGADTVISRATLGPLLAELFVGYFFHLFGYRGARKLPVTPAGMLGLDGGKP